MFTLEEIQAIHDELKNGLPEFVQKLGAVGVRRYVTYISDGHSIYFGPDNLSLTSAPVHEPLAVSRSSDREQALRSVERHERNLTDYLTFSKELADSGVETWIVDIREGTIKFCDMTGKSMLEQTIEGV
jgi:uncharacterized protein YbcV (DUF1398 family)